MTELDNLRSYVEKYNAKILAVSKTKSCDDIQRVIDCGFHMFGENRVFEIIEKSNVFKDQIVHLIGHLQSNKVKQVLPYVDCIQSVDSLKLAKLLVKNEYKKDVLLQIKTGNEESKTGFSSLDEMYETYNFLKESKTINVKGIMSIAINTSDKNIIKSCFDNTYKVYQELQKYDKNIDTLSMGMSNDYKIALDCGSNLVRIGSLIFGSRV